MILYKRKNMAESFRLAIFLTLTGGFQDAYSYFARGGVFANAQTGNVVLLAREIVSGDFEGSIRYIVPIIAFSIGVFIAINVESHFEDKLNFNWRQMVLLTEIIIAASCAFIPETYNNVCNALLSSSCAMQITAFKKIKGLSTNTAMCVGNIRNASDHLAKYFILKDRNILKNSLHYYAIVFVFAIGAALGYAATEKFSLKGIWGVLIFLITAFVLFFFEEKKDKREE